MQSGISASPELQTAFNTLVSSPTQRALLAGIENETLVPRHTIPLSASDFSADLSQLAPHLTPTAAAYILLKTHPGAADGCAAITYVPNAAPVRQKMLFAATRLTLVRELGQERFRTALFCTEAAELTPEGWERQARHEGLAAPLTEEEQGLRGVREAEAAESGGTGGRRGHVREGVEVRTAEGVLEALREVGGKAGGLVTLKFELPDETLRLASQDSDVTPASLADRISATEPRYSFYAHAAPEHAAPQVVFLYTCPAGSRVKERMVYSTGKLWTRKVAERDAGVVVARSLEASEPGEITAEVVLGEFEAKGPETKREGFSRPKRPGRK